MTGTVHMQLSVDAARWPDNMLEGFLEEDGRSLTGPEVRKALLDMKAEGLSVVPCCDNTDPKTGRCLGLKK